VYFADENNGWAAGAAGTALETHDGAQRWKPLAATLQLGDPNVTYRWIAFANPQAGLILGSDELAQDAPLPDWLDPRDALNRSEWRQPTMTLQTLDAGKTWQFNSVYTLGQNTRSRFAPPARGIGLVEHAQSSRYPSEVWGLSWPTGANELVYRDENFFVSDVWVTPRGAYYLAGLALTSKLRDVVPQKVRVLASSNLKEWKALDVDYRAVANRVILAGAGDDLWMAADNGMILKLVR
jgi:photosystem II stability/assembly factor-like uncharacterized protein